MAALFILYKGARYRPYESLRKNFIKQMKALYKHKKRALKKAGAGASEISQEDTRRRINNFYEQARSILFHAYKEEPTGLYRYSRVMFIVVFTLCIFLLLMMLIATSLKVVSDDRMTMTLASQVVYFYKEMQ